MEAAVSEAYGRVRTELSSKQKIYGKRRERDLGGKSCRMSKIVPEREHWILEKAGSVCRRRQDR
jgi:hypothetical protein